jgi:hypothetical protein
VDCSPELCEVEAEEESNLTMLAQNCPSTVVQIKPEIAEDRLTKSEETCSDRSGEIETLVPYLHHVCPKVFAALYPTHESTPVSSLKAGPDQ